MRFINIIINIVVFLFLGTGVLYPQEKMVLTLRQSIDMALSKNSGLAALKEKVEESKAALGEAKTGFLPSITSSANYTKLDVAPFMPGKIFQKGMPSIPGMPEIDLPKRITIGRDEIFSVGVTLQQPLFTGFRVLNGYKMAKEGLKATNAEYLSNKNKLIFRVEEAYWSVVKAEKFLELAKEAVRQVNKHLTDLENMHRVGMVTKNDLLKARVQLSNAKLREIQAANGLQLAKKAFCNLVGIPLDSNIKLVQKLEYKPFREPSIEDASLQALNMRPEISSFKSGLKVSENAVKMAEAGYYPNLALVLNYGYNKPDRLYNMQFYTTWNISVVASMNIFDWGRTYYKRSQAQRRLNQMRENFKDLERGIRLEVIQVCLKLKEAEERIKIAEKNVEQAEENFNVTEDLFQQGMATNSDYLDATTLLTQAKTDYITALADYNIAKAKLKQVTGTIGKGE